jgi:hypothetical protein
MLCPLLKHESIGFGEAPYIYPLVMTRPRSTARARMRAPLQPNTAKELVSVKDEDVAVNEDIAREMW